MSRSRSASSRKNSDGLTAIENVKFFKYRDSIKMLLFGNKHISESHYDILKEMNISLPRTTYKSSKLHGLVEWELPRNPFVYTAVTCKAPILYTPFAFSYLNSNRIQWLCSKFVTVDLCFVGDRSLQMETRQFTKAADKNIV